jgi:Zn-dependent protease
MAAFINGTAAQPEAESNIPSRLSNNGIGSGAQSLQEGNRSMFQSLKLGKLFGIDLYIHGTFWLLPLFVLISGMLSGVSVAALGGELVFIFAIFACVALHEVGHALAARAYGIHTREITLYPVGGVASLERMPEKPGREIAIALAGPAVNVVIAVALFAGLVGGVLLDPLSAFAAEPGAVEVFASKLMWANVVLAVFNMLPAFPMDGGRVLRAILATRLPRERATAAAVGVGSFVAAGFVIAGMLIPNYSLVAVAIVVYLLGQAELAQVRFQTAAREFGERAQGWFGGRTAGAPPIARGFTGMVWDEARGLWVQYVDGNVVRVIDPPS